MCSHRLNSILFTGLLVAGSGRPRRGRGANRPGVAGCHRRRHRDAGVPTDQRQLHPRLRGHHGRSRLVLGSQLHRPAWHRRRWRQRGREAGRRRCGAPVQGGPRRRRLHLWTHHRKPGLLLGDKREWPDRLRLERSVQPPTRRDAGGRQYRLLRTGGAHACAITSADVTFCWGLNDNGQVGDGTTTTRRAPVRVSGGVKFVRISAGGWHNCGVTAAKKAWCWGWNRYGQIGNRSSTDQLIPTGVSDGRSFDLVSAGGAHTCGSHPRPQGVVLGMEQEWNAGRRDHIAPLASHRGRRWTRLQRREPRRRPHLRSHHGGAAIAGAQMVRPARRGHRRAGRRAVRAEAAQSRRRARAGLKFDAVIAANGTYGTFTCGIATGARGYCWGENTQGYLGDGTTTNRNVPVPITDPS